MEAGKRSLPEHEMPVPRPSGRNVLSSEGEIIAGGGECAEDNGVNEGETNYVRPLSSPNKAFQTYPVTDAA